MHLIYTAETVDRQAGMPLDDYSLLLAHKNEGLHVNLAHAWTKISGDQLLSNFREPNRVRSPKAASALKRDGYSSQWREAQVDGLHVCRKAQFGSGRKSQPRAYGGPQARQAGACHCNAPGASSSFQRLQPGCLTSARGGEESERQRLPWAILETWACDPVQW